MYEFRSPNIEGDNFITVVLYQRVQPRFAQGGLVAAEAVRGMGRGGDEVLVHVNPDEFRQMQVAWGEPSINPETGLPEYGFFSKVGRAFKKLVKSPIFQAIAPIALNLLVPGLGVALGGALGASGAAAGYLGNAVLGAGLGAAGGGGRGALAGALGGIGSAGGASALGGALGASGNTAKILGSALIGGTQSKIRGGEFGRGALTGGALAAASPLLEAGAGKLRGLFGAQPEAASSLAEVAAPSGAGTDSGLAPPPPASSTEVGPPSPGDDLAASLPVPQAPEIQNPVTGALASAVKLENLPKTLAAVGAIGQLIPQGAGQAQQPGGPPVPQGPLTQLPQLDFNRNRDFNVANYYTYGSGDGGEYDFFKDEEFTTADSDGMGFAMGGEVEDESPEMGGRYFQGPGTGRSDEIDAKLSDGEYVFDAETVALLGDGSSDAGAAKLDELRRKIRAYKGAKLAEGEISDDAPDPAELLDMEAEEDPEDVDIDLPGEEMIEEELPEEELPMKKGGKAKSKRAA